MAEFKLSPEAIEAVRVVLYRGPMASDIRKASQREHVSLILTAAVKAQPVVAVGSEASEIVAWLRRFAPTDQAVPVDHIANRIENAWCKGHDAPVVALPPCPACGTAGVVSAMDGQTIEDPCLNCKGSGVIPVSTVLEWLEKHCPYETGSFLDWLDDRKVSQ